MIISLDDSEATRLEPIRAFLAGTAKYGLQGKRREEVYGWVERTLVRRQHASLDRAGKGLIRRYLGEIRFRNFGLAESGYDIEAVAYGRFDSEHQQIALE